MLATIEPYLLNSIDKNFSCKAEEKGVNGQVGAEHNVKLLWSGDELHGAVVIPERRSTVLFLREREREGERGREREEVY
jgi:hypothetical protein